MGKLGSDNGRLRERETIQEAVSPVMGHGSPWQKENIRNVRGIQ